MKKWTLPRFFESHTFGICLSLRFPLGIIEQLDQYDSYTFNIYEQYALQEIQSNLKQRTLINSLNTEFSAVMIISYSTKYLLSQAPRGSYHSASLSFLTTQKQQSFDMQRPKWRIWKWYTQHMESLFSIRQLFPLTLVVVVRLYEPTKNKLENIIVPNARCKMVNTEANHENTTNHLVFFSFHATFSSWWLAQGENSLTSQCSTLRYRDGDLVRKVRIPRPWVIKAKPIHSSTSISLLSQLMMDIVFRFITRLICTKFATLANVTKNSTNTHVRFSVVDVERLGKYISSLPSRALKSVINLSKLKARMELTAGDPRTIRNVRTGRREDNNASSGVLEPIVAKIVGVRPRRTPALPKFALVYLEPQLISIVLLGSECFGN